MEQVAKVIEYEIAKEVEKIEFNQIVGGPTDEDGDYAVNVEQLSEKIASVLEFEGLLA